MPTPEDPAGLSWAIALIASRAALLFLRNALTSICRCGIDPAIVRVGVAAAELDVVGRVVEGFGANVVRLGEDAVAAGESVESGFLLYGTEAFDRFTRHKYPLVRALLAEGNHVVYSDIDIAWLRDPLPYLTHVLAHYCCAVQTESDEYPMLPLCSGFLAFAPRPPSLRLLDAQIRNLAVDVTSDQDMLRATIANDPEFLKSAFPLPEGLFPNGLLEHVSAMRHRENGIMGKVLQPFVFHANWTVGAENKRALLERAGAWFLEESPAAKGAAAT